MDRQTSPRRKKITQVIFSDSLFVGSEKLPLAGPASEMDNLIWKVPIRQSHGFPYGKRSYEHLLYRPFENFVAAQTIGAAISRYFTSPLRKAPFQKVGSHNSG